MSQTNGSVASLLDFAETTTTAGLLVRPGGRPGLRVARPSRLLQGPGKYKLLEQRRRQAQIRARRLLQSFDQEPWRW